MLVVKNQNWEKKNLYVTNFDRRLQRSMGNIFSSVISESGY